MNRDLRRALDDEPMRPFQWLAVAVCIVLNLIDGFDVLVMAFTASSVAAEWNLGGAEIGLLLSAGLFGMAAGSLFIAPWADRWGRRPLILACLALSGLGMLASALSQAAWQLALLRGLTGLGIGGILASSNVIASEYASRRWRGLAVSLQSTGYALGATLGGLLAVWLIGAWGWRSVFVFGAGLTLAVIPLVCLCLPESLDFLLARRPPRALQRVNALARRLGRAALAELPSPPGGGAEHGSRLARLLCVAQRRTTLLLWALFFLVMFGFYFIMSWTPKLLVAAGLSTAQGITGGTLLSIGGIFGAALLGGLAARFRLERVLALFMLLTAALLALFSLSAGLPGAALPLGLLIGLCANACVAGLYALAPSLYDASVRATGVGWGIGVGRGGDPLAAGGRAPARRRLAAAVPLWGVRGGVRRRGRRVAAARCAASRALADAGRRCVRAAGVSALGGDDRLGDGGAEPVQRRRAFAALVPVQGDVERRQGEGQFEHAHAAFGDEAIGDLRRQDGQQLGTGNDLRQHREVRHPQADAALHLHGLEHVLGDAVAGGTGHHDVPLGQVLLQAQAVADPRVAVAEQAHVALVQDPLAARAGHRLAANRRVDLGAAQPGADLVHLQRQHFHFGERRVAGQAFEDQREETHFAEIGEGDAETSLGGRRIEVANALYRALDARQRLAEGAVELLGDEGRLDAVAGAGG